MNIEWTEESRLTAANFHEHLAKQMARRAYGAGLFLTRELAIQYARHSYSLSVTARFHRAEAAKFVPNPNWVKACGCNYNVACPSCSPESFHVDSAGHVWKFGV